MDLFLESITVCFIVEIDFQSLPIIVKSSRQPLNVFLGDTKLEISGITLVVLVWGFEGGCALLPPTQLGGFSDLAHAFW